MSKRGRWWGLDRSNLPATHLPARAEQAADPDANDDRGAKVAADLAVLRQWEAERARRDQA